MNKWRLYRIIFILLSLMFVNQSFSQCSICTKTAGQLGEKKAQSLNSGIIYLMLTPFAIAGFIGYKWWKSEKDTQAEVKDQQHS